jgi:hypothetical protein
MSELKLRPPKKNLWEKLGGARSVAGGAAL